MIKAHARIAQQTGSVGFFGDVELEVIMNLQHKDIELLMDREFETWRPGLLFGANYFLEHARLEAGLTISVIRIGSNPVDTNNTVIAFLTAKALSEALKPDWRGDCFLDTDIKAFVFRK